MTQTLSTDTLSIKPSPPTCQTPSQETTGYANYEYSIYCTCDPIVTTPEPEPTPSNEYTIIINSSNGGATTPSAGSYTYQVGTDFTITAQADSEYNFVNWTVNAETKTSNPYTITRALYGEEYTIQPNFEYVESSEPEPEPEPEPETPTTTESFSFGKTSVGSRQREMTDRIRGTSYYAPESGMAKNITAYITSWSSGEPIYAGIYFRSNNTLLAQTQIRSDGGYGWETFTFDEPVYIQGETDYVLVVYGDDYTRIAYDSNTVYRYFEYQTFTPNLPDPFTGTTGYANYEYSIYCSCDPTTTAP